MAINCKIITPMFMTGADGKTPELRPPSIKGALRFWWRAVQAQGDLAALKSDEAAIFGSSDAGRSKVVIRVNGELRHKGIKVLTHRDGETYNKTDRNGKIKKSFFKKGFCIGQELEICLKLTNEIKLTNRISFDEKMLERLFELTTLLGGLGTKTRRGYGSVKIINGAESESYIKHIFDLLEKVKEGTYKIDGNKIVNKINPDITNNSYPYIRSIEIGSAYDDMDNLLTKIGKVSSDCCNNGNKSYIGGINPRLASPVYVSVVEISGKFHPIITTLNTNTNNIETCKNVQNNFKEKILNG